MVEYRLRTYTNIYVIPNIATNYVSCSESLVINNLRPVLKLLFKMRYRVQNIYRRYRM